MTDAALDTAKESPESAVPAEDKLYEKTAEPAEPAKAEEPAKAPEADPKNILDDKPEEAEGEKAAEPEKKDDEKEPENKKDDKEEDKKDKEVVYDLNLPENSKVEQAQVDSVLALAKEHKMSNEQAQAVLNRDNAALVAHENEIADWRKQLDTDPDVGGEKLGENAELAKRACKAIWPTEFKEFLNKSGFGNHPMFFKGLVKLGGMMSEDKLALGGKMPQKTKKTTADILYNNTPSKE